MSPEGKAAARKLAERVYRDARRASVSDAEMLARAVLMLVDGKLPARKR